MSRPMWSCPRSADPARCDAASCAGHTHGMPMLSAGRRNPPVIALYMTTFIDGDTPMPHQDDHADHGFCHDFPNLLGRRRFLTVLSGLGLSATAGFPATTRLCCHAARNRRAVSGGWHQSSGRAERRHLPIGPRALRAVYPQSRGHPAVARQHLLRQQRGGIGAADSRDFVRGGISRWARDDPHLFVSH